MIREMLGIAQGILQDLHNDHGEVDTLLGNIMDSEDGAERARLFSEMTNKLLPPSRSGAGNRFMRGWKPGRRKSRRKFGHEGTREHRIVEEQVDKMMGMGNTMSDQWTAELKVLQDLIEHHVGEEESTGFQLRPRPRVRQGAARGDVPGEFPDAQGSARHQGRLTASVKRRCDGKSQRRFREVTSIHRLNIDLINT